MDYLADLSSRMAYPSADKLYDAARREGHKVTLKTVKAFVASQNVRQVFHKLPPSKGKITSPNLDDTWVADLVDYTSLPSQEGDEPDDLPFQYILLVQDIFSRRLMAAVLRDKNAETCEAAFKRIVEERGGVKPHTLSTDLGNEFQGVFEQYLENQGIYHRLKDPRSLNAQGTLDAAIRTIRPALSRILTQEKTKNWAGAVQRVVEAYNNTVHAHLHGRTPNEAQTDGDLQFHLEKEDAQAMRHNNDLIMRQDAKLAAAKHFRDELQPRKLHKVYHTTYSDEVHDVAHVFAGQLVDSNGKIYSARHTLPVPAGSSHINTEHTRGTAVRYRSKPDATFPAPGSPARPTLKPMQATAALQQASGSFAPPPAAPPQYAGVLNFLAAQRPAPAPPRSTGLHTFLQRSRQQNFTP